MLLSESTALPTLALKRGISNLLVIVCNYPVVSCAHQHWGSEMQCREPWDSPGAPALPAWFSIRECPGGCVSVSQLSRITLLCQGSGTINAQQLLLGTEVQNKSVSKSTIVNGKAERELSRAGGF